MQSRLSERKLADNYRTLKPENELIDFCSNDYLGFARSAELKSRIASEVDNHPDQPNGSTGSRLISGNLAYAETSEQMIAAYHGAESGLLFHSGYDANLALFSALPQKGDTIIYDELIHASIIDGARLSNANRYHFKHNNLLSLEKKLQHASGICYIVIESVYSMDGDTPPLSDILQLTQKYKAHLIVDEAHALGLYPKGLVAHLGLDKEVFARVVTFGKALGVHGAVILGSGVLRDYLINFARPFIYSTAPPFHQLVGIKMAYALLNESTNAIQQLRENIQIFKQSLLSGSESPLLPSDSAIQCILFNNNGAAKAAAEKCLEAGFDVRPILSPTVPEGTERVRICIHTFNSPEDIRNLAQALNKYIRLQPAPQHP